MKYSNSIAAILIAAPCMAQLYEGRFDYVPITGNPSTGPQVTYGIDVDGTNGLDSIIYRILIILRFSDVDGQFLRPDSIRLAFAPGSEIGPGAIPYLDNAVEPPARIRLLRYKWTVQFPGNRLSSELGYDNYPNQSSILIGFTRLYQGGWQYGWVHMEREVTRFEDMLLPDGSTRDFAFRPKGFAIHPIPGRPIRAGMEPELPSLSTELVTLGGDGGEGIRVSWPTGWPGMVLEYASELKQPTEWLPVAGVAGSQAVVKLPEDGHVFFRLRYAP